MNDHQFECHMQMLSAIFEELQAIRGHLEKQASPDAVLVGERGPEVMVFPGEAGRHQSAGFTVVVDTSRPSLLLQRMNSLLAKGEELGLHDEYLKEQAQLFEEVVHILPKTIKFSTQFRDSIPSESDRLSA
jgi:hypothetical protein